MLSFRYCNQKKLGLSIWSQYAADNINRDHIKQLVKKVLTHEDDVSERLVIGGSNFFDVATISDPEKVPGDLSKILIV
jgi:hypothetical protein